MSTFVSVIHVATCVLLVIVVLLQSGKGAEISASLAGSSQTVFGSSGGANFFTRLTFTLAMIFMITSLGLTVLGSRDRRSMFDTSGVPAASAPATTTGAAAPAQTTAEAPKTNDSAKNPTAAPAKK